MRKYFVACLVALTVCGADAATEHLLPEKFFGSYLANRSTEACLRREREGKSLPAYLVVQARYFRYGYTNPKADHSLDAMVCRATEPVVVTDDSMEVRSECFLTDQLVQRHFRFTKRAGVLRLRDLERQTEEEFEACYP
ncbi:hypothetical protein [Comamonas endophytica]|uniref:Uncharacterized protein n=1 Tax=Comamonas endophytica TaxID=2949090 RepID=A0ABY6GBN2_9BURK|nr:MULTISPECIES: hypothetical protein [unclassified Acidovorax]MCD2512097.1 hypothetical protein [Acidovorax sp. D4N7]UYG51874.1 hypothetical protein M9799_01060 [Acidovorax sp. 5MLIR]